MLTAILIAVQMLVLPTGAVRARDTCLDCHTVQEGTSIPFKNDIHYKNGVSCADCHGGDRTVEDGNLSMSVQRGFLVRVTRDGVAQYCGRCHSDAAYMKKHNPKQRVDQVKLYTASVHAGRPAGSETVAATCIDCHSIHNIRAVSDPQSTAAPKMLARTCGKCHADSSEVFQKSAHAPLFVSGARPSCATCHDSHAVARVSNDMLAGGRAVCSKCHEPDSKGGRTAAALGRTFENTRVMSFTPPPPRADAARAAGPGAPGEQGRVAGPGVQGEQGRAVGPGGQAGQGRGAMPGGRGGRPRDPRMMKALSLVHSLDVQAVKAALEAGQQQQ